MSFDLQKDPFSINPRYRLQWEEAQQCHVLLYPEGLVKLSDSAAEVLGRCQTVTTSDALIKELQQAYPTADTIVDDVNEFLQHAQQQEWILRYGD
jgi:pyrroloquinoline quinone biosynthesis protein D